MNDLQKQIKQLQKEYDILDGIIDIKDAVIAELKEVNERIIKENVMLLSQLVINDGEDATVQITKSQFDDYNKIRTCLQEIKEIAEKTIDIYYPDYYDEGFEEDIVTEFGKQVLDLITKAEEE